MYWGANKANYGTPGTASLYYAGPIPAAGQWVRLEVPAKALGLEGHSVTMMAFTLFDGRVTWDKTGKSTPSATATTTPTTTTSTTTSTTTTRPEFVWFDDALPTGASGFGNGGDSWNWVTSSPAPFSGTKAHQTNLTTGVHEHAFGWGSTMTVNTGDKLFAYVYVDPANPPSQIMISWGADNWEHRAYWGTNKVNYGTPGTASQYYVGPIPAGGQWVRLEVPASAVNLEGKTVSMMSFMLFDGRVTWDKVGKQ